MKFKEVEAYRTPEGLVMLAESGKPVREYTQEERQFTSEMLNYIREFYTEAHRALGDLYRSAQLNKPYYEYLMVHRFIRCNMSEYDNVPDIDTMGIFRLEFVSCPLRGECKYCGIICNPEFNTKLSARESEVMKCYFNRMKPEDIADKLFISIHTVLQHKRNALRKLNLHSVSEFISYAARNHMYDKQP